MLSMRPRKLLSMVIEHQAIVLAEVVVGRTMRVVRHDRFVLPADVSFDKPQELGAKLAEFLRQHKYAAKQVIIGLPGRWTMLKAKTLPPCNATAAAALLRLAIEREYHDSAREWTFDYLTQSADSQATHVLLAAAPRNRLQQLRRLAQVAGFSISAIVPAKLSLAGATPRQGDAASLYLSDEANELVVWKAGKIVGIERLVQAVDSAELFAGELMRTLAVHGVSPTQIQQHDARSSEQNELSTVWHGSLSLPVVTAESEDQQMDVATKLVTLWHSQPATLIDFEHARVQAPAPSRFTRLHMIGACALLAILLGAGYLTLDWYLQWRSVNELQSQLASMKMQLTSARTEVNRLSHARGWYDNRPDMLNGIRDLTLAFPTKGQVWTTSLIMRDDLTGTLAAKAEDEKAAINLIEGLRATPGFTDVKMLYLRQADRTSKTVSFALNFNYTGKD